MPAPVQTHAAAKFRNLVLVLWIVGVLGTAAELLLLRHIDGAWQWTPLLLIAAALLVLAWYAFDRRKASLRVFQAASVLFVIGGCLGVTLHFWGKVEFKRETNPSLAGWELFREALKGAMPPILAPGAMIHFGLLGLAWTFWHPLLAPSLNNSNRNT